MRWVTTRHIQSTDGKTEKITCELRLTFPPSQWNKKEERPVLTIEYYDYKVESGWWIDEEMTNWHIYHPHKNCTIKVTYFPSFPKIELHSIRGKSKYGRIPYEEFSVEYCKKQGEKIIRERFNALLNELGDVHVS